MHKISKPPALRMLAIVLSAGLTLTACGGGSGSSGDSATTANVPSNGTQASTAQSSGAASASATTPTTPTTPSAPPAAMPTVTPPMDGNARLMFKLVAAGAECTEAVGGVQINAGIDRNNDGQLAPSETTSTQFACYRAPGAAGTPSTTGMATLISLVAEPAGAACASGGRKLSVGLDSNGNGVLDGAKATKVSYLCSDASTTVTGGNVYVALADEPKGAACTYAGKQIATNMGGVTALSYLCYDAPGLNLTWKRVSTAIAQLAANFGHIIATASSANVELALPAEPSIKINDTLVVRGETATNWRIAQAAGQTIGTRNLSGAAAWGATFTPQTATQPQNWWAIASSASGTRLAAVANNFLRVEGAPATGSVWTSADGGSTWTERTEPGNQPWSSISSSADGQMLAAVAPGAKIWLSFNAGVSWVQRDADRFWVSVTMSLDGSHMTAAELGGRIYTSADSGTTWTPRDSVRGWRSVASSADGKNLVAAVYTDESANAPNPLESIYTSSDFGVTWKPSQQTFLTAYRVASSRDGVKLTMAERYGKIYTSSDSGVTWVQRTAPDGGFNAIASSANGNVLVAVKPDEYFGAPRDGKIYVSLDSGATWSERQGNALWRGVAVSADGNHVVAGVNNGLIYTSSSNRTTVGTAGSITGGQTNDISLRYLGDGLYEAESGSGPTFTLR